ncbi:MAG: PilZ domain-containing protein [Spirochaetales bacterium]|nr:PilZ domain-containing protein [Spirochaetales bacterium]
MFKKPIEKINFYNMSDQDDSDFERRRSERLQDPVQVKVQIIDGNNNKSRTHFEFVNKDISENGIFIISNDLDILKPGQEINISVFDERGPVFEGMGQVVHRQAVFSPEMVAEEGGFGIRFIKKAIV